MDFESVLNGVRQLVETRSLKADEVKKLLEIVVPELVEGVDEEIVLFPEFGERPCARLIPENIRWNYFRKPKGKSDTNIPDGAAIPSVESIIEAAEKSDRDFGCT